MKLLIDEVEKVKEKEKRAEMWTMTLGFQIFADCYSSNLWFWSALDSSPYLQVTALRFFCCCCWKPSFQFCKAVVFKVALDQQWQHHLNHIYNSKLPNQIRWGHGAECDLASVLISPLGESHVRTAALRWGLDIGLTFEVHFLIRCCQAKYSSTWEKCPINPREAQETQFWGSA